MFFFCRYRFYIGAKRLWLVKLVLSSYFSLRGFLLGHHRPARRHRHNRDWQKPKTPQPQPTPKPRPRPNKGISVVWNQINKTGKTNKTQCLE
uniref:Putative secreted protein n=1 Tax=Anopheles triannulatus TaxID=58253 RepID=A0A2M4B0Z2_9DIPT